MRKIIENIIVVGVASILLVFIINCQESQRRCNIEPEILEAGQHKEVYYQYQDYMNNRSFKNN